MLTSRAVARRAIAAVAVLGAALFGCGSTTSTPPPPPQPMMTFTPTNAVPANNTVTLQENSDSANSVTVDVVATGVTDLASVFFDLTFRPGVMSFSSHSPGAFLNTAGNVEFIVTEDDSGGNARLIVGITVVPATTGVTGSGVLGSFTFARVANGSTFLSFERSGARDPDGPISLSFSGGSVVVQ